MDRFRILSLDGGGIKGAFSSAVLAALEKSTGKKISDYFDLITGTSIGGIIAISLGLGLKAEEMCDFFQKSGPIIFPSTSMVQRTSGLFTQIFKVKFSHDTLKKELEKVFKNKKFGESKNRLVINTYDAIGGRIFLLKTAHHKRFQYDINAPAVDVALATSAAPTYFSASPFPDHKDASYVDGGVWAHCPALVGIVEAVHFLNIPINQIDVLSIGTTNVPFNIAKHKKSGILKWNIGLVDLMFNAQIEASIAHAKLLVNNHLHRIDIKVEPGRFSLDDARPEKINELINLGRGEAVKKEHIEEIEKTFMNNKPVKPFIPIIKIKEN